MREDEWIMLVDEELAKIRIHKLGQDISFSHFLPHGGWYMSEAEQADWLTARLTFALGELCREADSGELGRAWQWLYGAIRFLHTECNEDDHNFATILRLIDLDRPMRAHLFPIPEEYPDPYKAIRTEYEPPEIFSCLEEAMVRVAAGPHPLRLGVALPHVE